ncbi:shikimate kinase [Chloroflexales bacterium ZM16-3]|nr:shikimate kinase [Chloroflexales bacterium ZM16-3]
MAARGIYLIGFSGTGKSTVAQLVAAQLGWTAYDIDRMIVEHSGVDIPAIFAREGEAGFRERETAALRDISGAGMFVAATGGGLPLREENRELMGRMGWVIALEGRPETLHARIERHRQMEAPDAIRPLLDTESPLEHIRALKQRRQPVYALADWTVHTDRLSPQQVADEIVRAVAILQEL